MKKKLYICYVFHIKENVKHLKHIVFGLLTLAVFSCQKEEISSVTSNSERQQPQWNPTMIMENTENSGNSNNGSGSVITNSNGSSDGNGDVIIINSGEATDGGTGITDPNNDPDQTKKKGKK